MRTTLLQKNSRQHDPAPKPTPTTGNESALKSAEASETRWRRRERKSEIDERDRERKSKSEVPLGSDHRSSLDEKTHQQRPRSSQELKHPRSPVLNGVIFPLLSDVIRFSCFFLNIISLEYLMRYIFLIFF